MSLENKLTLHIAGHDIDLIRDDYGTWLVHGMPYTLWLEDHAPQEVVEAAARKGLMMAVIDPEATEDAIQSLEMPDDMAETLRSFYPEL